MDQDESRKRLDPDGGDVRRVLHTASRSDRAFSSAARRPGGRTDRANREAPHPLQPRSRSTTNAAFAVLEKLNRGVLLLDADGVVRFMNGAARVMLNRSHGLTLRERRLVFAESAAATAFEACVERKADSLLLRVGGPNHAHRPYAVLVSVLGGQDAPGGFCVFIHEPLGRQRPVPAQVLRELYGLTAAEARLTNALYVGQSLQSAAGTVGIAHNTAKSVLKRVFVKCEVGTQAELLQMLSLGPRTL